MENRQVCPSCHQNLSRSAYYRHKNESVCPGKNFTQPLNQQNSEAQSQESPASDYCNDTESATLQDESMPCYETSDSELYSNEVEEDCDDQVGIEVFDENDAREIERAEELTNGNHGTELHSEQSLGRNNTESQEATAQSTIEKTDVQKKCLSLVRTLSYFLIYFQLKFKIPDRAIYFLLILIKAFLFSLVAVLPPNNFISELRSIFPTTLYMLKENSPLSFRWEQSVKKYAVCPKCSTIHPLDHFSHIPQVRPFLNIPRCNFIEFPNHPQRSRRIKCNGLVMKQIKCGSKYKLVPNKTFLFNSIIESLKDIMEC